MTHAADFVASALDDCLTEFGQAVTYTPTGSAAVVTVGIFRSDSGPVVMDDDRRGVKRAASISVPLSAVPVVTPDRDTVTIGATVWTVTDDRGVMAGMQTVGLERYETIAQIRRDRVRDR